MGKGKGRVGLSLLVPDYDGEQEVWPGEGQPLQGGEDDDEGKADDILPGQRGRRAAGTGLVLLRGIV